MSPLCEPRAFVKKTPGLAGRGPQQIHENHLSSSLAELEMIDAKVLGNVFSDVKLCIDVACDVSWVVITVIQLRKTEREQSPQRK